MTARELEELLDSKIRELLVKQLEELEENSPANLFARKMFDDVMQHHKIPYYYRVRRRLEQ